MWWAEQQWDIFLQVLQFSHHYHPISSLYSFITDATKYLRLTKSLNNTPTKTTWKPREHYIYSNCSLTLITTALHENFCMKVSIIFIIKMFHINQMHNYKHADSFNIFTVYLTFMYQKHTL